MTDDRLDLPSASKFDIIVNCPGMPNLARTIPPVEADNDSTPEADRGTRIHHAREISSTMHLQDEGEMKAYTRLVDNERIILSEWSDEKNLEMYNVETELRLWLFDPITGAPITSGRLDVLYVESGTRTPHVLVIDTKTLSGLSAGSAVESWQLKVQAVLSRFEFGARHVRVAFNKPEALGKEIDVCDLDTAMLDQCEYMIRYHLWLTTLPNAPRRAGEWCNWCVCKGHCPEAGAMALLPMAVSAGGVLARIDTLSPADLRKIWDVSAVIKKVLGRVDARLASMSEEQLASVGLRLGKPRETDSIVDVPLAMRRLRESGLMPEDIVKCAKIGKGELTKLVRREFALSSDDKAEAWIARVLGDCMETKEGAAPVKEIR